MRKMLIPFFLYTAVSLSSEGLSLKEAHALARLQNSTLVRDTLESQNERRQLQLQMRRFFPGVELGYSQYDSVSLGSADSRVDQLSLGITQLLFSGGRERTAYRSAKRSLDLRDLLFYSLQEEILYQVTLEYVNILKNRQILKIQKESCVNLNRQLDIAAMEYQLGEIRRLDYLDMRLAASESLLRIAETGEGLRVSRFQLAELLSISENKLPLLEGRLNGEFSGNFFPAVESGDFISRLMALAEDHNGSLINLKQEELNARAGLTETRLGWLPRIEATGDFSFSGREYPLREPSFSLGLSFQFDLPLLPGSLDLQGGQAARDEYNRTIALSGDVAGNMEGLGDPGWARSVLTLKQMELETARRSIFHQISALVEGIRMAGEKNRIQREKISLLSEKMKIQITELELGQITRLSYVESGLDLADQRIALLESLVELYQCEEELIHLCGTSVDFPRKEGLIDE